VYDAIHAEVLRRVGTEVPGLLVHLARPTADGFEIVEVWESHEHFDHYTVELVAPVVAELSGGRVPLSSEQVTAEFEVRGLVIPQGNIAR